MLWHRVWPHGHKPDSAPGGSVVTTHMMTQHEANQRPVFWPIRSDCVLWGQPRPRQPRRDRQQLEDSGGWSAAQSSSRMSGVKMSPSSLSSSSSCDSCERKYREESVRSQWESSVQVTWSVWTNPSRGMGRGWGRYLVTTGRKSPELVGDEGYWHLTMGSGCGHRWQQQQPGIDPWLPGLDSRTGSLSLGSILCLGRGARQSHGCCEPGASSLGREPRRSQHTPTREARAANSSQRPCECRAASQVKARKSPKAPRARSVTAA